MLPLLPSRTVDSCTTDIWFVVSVPVLSLQMTVVHPRVSTEGSFLQSTDAAQKQLLIDRLVILTLCVKLVTPSQPCNTHAAQRQHHSTAANDSTYQQ
jgi:hypothetical protein